jgi:hypothetical protein
MVRDSVFLKGGEEIYYRTNIFILIWCFDATGTSILGGQLDSKTFNLRLKASKVRT